MGNPVISIRTHSDGSADLISNDGTHEGHGPDNPDTGETSAFALALAEELKKLGLETTVTRLD